MRGRSRECETLRVMHATYAIQMSELSGCPNCGIELSSETQVLSQQQAPH